jgi:hypothetical protein
VQNKALARAVVKEGFEVSWLWTAILTWRDNLGYFDGSPLILQEYFYSIFREIEPVVTVPVEKVKSMRDTLEAEGLIIVYTVNGRDYIMIPKIGVYSRIVGNMAESSKYPPCPDEKIQAWEQRFNDVYTPSIRRSYNVHTEGQGQVKGQGKDKVIPGGRHEQPAAKTGKPKDECDFILNWMKGLGLTGKEQTDILLAWHPGLKKRGRCYDCKICEREWKGCIERTRKANPKHFGAYLVKTVNNFITGD